MNVSYSASELYNKINSNGNKYVTSYRKRIREADTNVQDLQEDIESFRKCVRNLKNYDSDTITQSKLEKYLNKFADSYNELKESADKITDKELSKSLTKLENLMEENKKSLKKLGLKESDGKWTFDSDLLEETSNSDINKLFEGNDAMFKQMDKLMRKAEKTAEEEAYQMVVRNCYTVTQYSQEEMEQAFTVCSFPNTIEYLQNNNSLIENADLASGDIPENVILGLQTFCGDYNAMLGSSIDATKEYVGYMAEKTKEYENDLKNIGITLGENGKLSYSADAVSAANFKTSYAALFGENAAYGNLMKTYTKKIFNITMKTESLGITIDSYA